MTIPLPFCIDWELSDEIVRNRPQINSKVYTYLEARGSVATNLGRYLRESSSHRQLGANDRNLIGQMWNIPYDGRVPLTFSAPIFGLFDDMDANLALQDLAEACKDIAHEGSSMLIHDWSEVGSEWTRAIYVWNTPNNFNFGTQNVKANLVVGEYRSSADWCRHM